MQKACREIMQEDGNLTARGKCVGAPGFSVLEAIIAIAILSIALMPLLALQEQMTRTTLSLERNEQLMGAKRSALAYIRNINPMREPNGTISLGSAQMRWQAVPIAQERPVKGVGGADGRFVAALYDVQVTLAFADQRTQVFSVHAFGWRAARPLLDGL